MRSPRSFPANGKQKTGVPGSLFSDSSKISYTAQICAYESPSLVQRATLDLAGFLEVLVESPWGSVAVLV